ncbi:MAG: hypothetical protein MJ078_07565, partial [Clostridia bacterium]|nr:hypothetical protein [Clostridia bacterium]
VETGKNHGVYVKSPNGNVKKFLHKQTVETLKKEGAVDERNKCNIDTGALWLSPVVMEKLYGLVDTEEKYASIVNDKVRLSLYGDIAYCMAEDSTLKRFYKEAPEGDFCEELTAARERLWDAISIYRMKLLNLSPARFVHFGSISEILRLMDTGVNEYASLGWKKQISSSISRKGVAGYNSILSDKATIGKGCYLEVSFVHSGSKVGSNCYLSFVDIHGEKIPDNVLLHGLKQMNGKFVCRIMDVSDNPKSGNIFRESFESVTKKLHIPASALWEEGEAHTLWNAKLYPECDTIKEAVAAALSLYDLFVNGSGDKEAWLNAGRKSLCSGFNDADSRAIIDWVKRMEELVKMDEIMKLIQNSSSAEEGVAILNAKRLTKIQEQWLEKELQKLDCHKLPDFSLAIRLYYYLGVALHDESYIRKCF